MQKAYDMGKECMNKRYRLRIDVLNMLLRAMVTFALVSMLSIMFTNSSDYIWKSLILFPASVISFIIDRYAKHIISLIIPHLGLMAIYFFIADDASLRVIYMTYIMVWMVTQFTLGLLKKPVNTSLFFIIPLLAMYSICRHTFYEEAAVSRLFFYLTLAYGLIYIVNMYFINFQTYLEKHKEKENLPVRQIIASNRIYMAIFLYLTAVSMLVFRKFPLDKLFKAIGGLIVRFLRFALSGLQLQQNTPVEEMPQMDDIPEDMNELLDTSIIMNPEPSRIWIIIERVFITLMIALIVIFLLMILVVSLYRIYKLFYLKKLSADKEKIEVASLLRDSWSSFFDKVNTRRKKLLQRYGNSNNERIRKLYHKAVVKHNKKEQELKYQTPKQLSRYAVGCDSNQAQEEKEKMAETLTVLYEKARYSKEECSRAEVREVKNLVK